MARAAATSDAFNAVAEPQRRRILVLLKGRERPVNELARALRITQPRTSKHLRVLREVGLVRVREAGQQRLYGLDARGLQPMHEWVIGFEQYWNENFDRLNEYVKKLKQKEHAEAAEASKEADREIVVSRIIEGPRRLVFDAFTSATHLAQWCAPTGGKITTHAFDFKPGGVWDATIQGPDGSEYPNHFVWKEIAPPERIVWMYGMGKDDPRPVKTTLTLAERGATTEATLRLVFGSKEERDEKVAKYYAAQGAQQSLDSLAAYVATLAGEIAIERPTIRR